MRSKDRCFICRNKDHLLHLELSVGGDEGIKLCKDCEKLVSSMVKGMASVSGRARLHGLQVGLYLKKEEKHDE